jgi:hypothetical protein
MENRHALVVDTRLSLATGTAEREAALKMVAALLARRPTKVAAIALANKIARMAWAVMARSERYREPIALAA